MKLPKYFYTFVALSVVSGALFQGCAPAGNTQTTTTTTSNSSFITPAVFQNYKDGTYNETASYNSPAGQENITVKFVVAGNIVTDVQLSSDTTHGLAQRYQGLFAQGIQQQVVGMNVNNIGTFGRVNGSSLTSSAFNQAVNELKAEAKA